MPTREEEYEEALRACGVYDEEWRGWRSLSREWIAEIVPAVMEVADGERNRYRLAWISARRRAVVEANYGQEAMDFMRAQVSQLQRRRPPLVD